MAIRKRLVDNIEPKFRSGYPTEQFVGFKMHFGEVVAVYMSPAMQALGGYADKSILNGPGRAEWRFYTAYTHARKRDELRQRGLNTGEMDAVADLWPKGAIPMSLTFYLCR